MIQLPAIVIGGPPHAGKSVLSYSITQRLRKERIEHYVLRACPDGEGDWSHETPPELVQLIRRKGKFSMHFLENVLDALKHRHLPLLVDMGGRPTEEQQAIFVACTHAIFIARDEATLHEWFDMARNHNPTIDVIACLISELDGVPEIFAAEPMLSARITGLERGETADGLVFDALIERIHTIFAVQSEQLRLLHQTQSPARFIELDRPQQIVTGNVDSHYWQPDYLPQLQQWLPKGEPVALYGRSANWVFATAAITCREQTVYQFDPRLGWVQVPRCRVKEVNERLPVRYHIEHQPKFTLINVMLGEHYLEYDDCQELPVPPIAPSRGVVISFKGPLWLQSAMAQAYSEIAPWVALYYPQSKCAIVTSTSGNACTLGEPVKVNGE